MIEVKVLKPHTNAYGPKPRKAKGESYSLPEDAARRLAAQGLVEGADADAKKAIKGDAKAEPETK